MTVLVVTGTGTGVGKTVVTAAIAACHRGRVAVVKPAQTGVAPGEPGDLDEVTRLTGCADVHEYARYPDPLAPAAAARRSGLPELALDDVAERVRALDAEHELVLVEGAGGLLVDFAASGHWTMRELINEAGADVVVVTEAGLGTLNHTALTLAALRRPVWLVIGSWPASPGLAELSNVGDLNAMSGGRLAGALPAGLAGMTDFAERSRAALCADLGGTFDVSAFCRHAHEQEQAWSTSST